MSSDTELFAPPVIIGALGGSGTRVVTRILRDAGWWMGGKLSASSEDSLPVRSFLAKWFDRLLVGDASPEMIENARADFSDAIAEHRQGIAHEAAPWGWKNPRNMWLMEFFAASYPRIKFVHMLRDGRDMSYSNNAYFLRQYGDRLYPGWRKNARVAQMEIWGIGNRRAASAARDLPGVAYHLLRYEDLCSKPAEAIAALLEFVGAPSGDAEGFAKRVKPSSGIGRWREMEPLPLSELSRAALEQFGYQ